MEDQISPAELSKFLNSMPEEIAYHHGIVLVGFSVKDKGTGWLLVVRVNKRLDGRMVAFIECSTLIGCFDYLATWCYRNNVPLKWAPDRFS